MVIMRLFSRSYRNATESMSAQLFEDRYELTLPTGQELCGYAKCIFQPTLKHPVC